MEQSRRAYFAQRLKALDHELAERQRRLEEGLLPGQRESLQELSAYDNHPADLGSEVFERSKDLALRESLKLRREAVREALARLEAGDYGYCRRCGKPIEEERLEALPETPWCADCRRVVESGRGHRRRPIEEAVVDLPFGGLVERESSVGAGAAHGGEDAWEEVARYGTSDKASEAPYEERAAMEEVDALPYYRDREDGGFYRDYSCGAGEKPPQRL